MHQMPSPFDPPPTRQSPARHDRFSGMTASMPMMHDPHEGRHVSPSQPVAQDKHWSGVAKKSSLSSSSSSIRMSTSNRTCKSGCGGTRRQGLRRARSISGDGPCRAPLVRGVRR